MRTRIMDGMTKRIEPQPLSGGPSDGKTYRPETKWPMYLDHAGEMLPAGKGDRIVNGRSAVKACYVLQRDWPTGKVTGYCWVEAK